MVDTLWNTGIQTHSGANRAKGYRPTHDTSTHPHTHINTLPHTLTQMSSQNYTPATSPTHRVYLHMSSSKYPRPCSSDARSPPIMYSITRNMAVGERNE